MLDTAGDIEEEMRLASGARSLEFILSQIQQKRTGCNVICECENNVLKFVWEDSTLGGNKEAHSCTVE